MGYLSQLFNIADENQDGCLQQNELYKLLSLSGLGFSAQMAAEVFVQADVNHDGKLQYEEYLQAMMTILAETKSKAEADKKAKIRAKVNAALATSPPKKGRDAETDN